MKTIQLIFLKDGEKVEDYETHYNVAVTSPAGYIVTTKGTSILTASAFQIIPKELITTNSKNVKIVKLGTPKELSCIFFVDKKIYESVNKQTHIKGTIMKLEEVAIGPAQKKSE